MVESMVSSMTKSTRSYVLPDDLYSRLKREADKIGLSMTAVLILALRSYLVDDDADAT